MDPANEARDEQMVNRGGEGGGGEGERSCAIIHANTLVNLKRQNKRGGSLGSKVSRMTSVGASPCTSKPDCNSLAIGVNNLFNLHCLSLFLNSSAGQRNMSPMRRPAQVTAHVLA